MEISYLGHSSFKIKGKNATVITDPFDPEFLGIKFPKIEADVVTVSHQHKDHNYLDFVTDPKLSKQPFVISAPGEYEVKGVNVLGISTFHDEENGAKRGKNTMFEINLDGMSILHLGDLGHKLTDQQTEGIEVVNILLIPVGGEYTIDAKVAQEVIADFEPNIVIPMHYKNPSNKSEMNEKLASVDEFLKAVGKTDVVAVDKFSITKDKLPEETQFVVLNS